MNDFDELREAVLLLPDWIEEMYHDVLQNGIRCTHFFEQNHVSCPKVFAHGPNSVVFTWENSDMTFCLIVSEYNLSWIKSNSTKLVRKELSTLNDLLNPALWSEIMV